MNGFKQTSEGGVKCGGVNRLWALRDGADPARVREELVKMGLPLEEAGGHVQCVEVSAHTGLGMEDLEMALFLEAEAMQLTARVDCEGEGYSGRFFLFFLFFFIHSLVWFISSS